MVTSSDFSPPGKEPNGASGRYYPLTSGIAKELRDIGLHASEWRLWSYLATLDPFGDRYLEMPDLVEILTECNISKATFYRALAKFEEHQLFDTQPLKIAFRNLRGQKIVSSMRNSDSPMRPPDSSVRNSDSSIRLSVEEKISEPLQSLDCEKEGSVPITDQTFKKNKTVPTTHPVSLNGKETGTNAKDPLELDIERLLERIRDSGVRPNKTISRTIATLHFHQGSAAAARAVENALSALSEQQAAGKVQNAGGFLNAALQKGFTANQAKRQARLGSHPSVETKPPLNTLTVSKWVDLALMSGDRAAAIAQLQRLWDEGWQDAIEELCLLHKRDWHFTITAQGVRDGAG